MIETIGTIVAALNFLAAVNSTWFFLKIAKVSYSDWFFFNACASSIAIYLIGYIFNSWTIMAISIPALTFFGFGGLFFFGWKGHEIIPQIGHLLMTAAIAWISTSIFVWAVYKEAVIGFLIASLVVPNFIAVQQKYAAANWQRFMSIMLMGQKKE